MAPGLPWRKGGAGEAVAVAVLLALVAPVMGVPVTVVLFAGAADCAA